MSDLCQNRYTLLYTQIQVTPAIGQPRIVPVFGLKLATGRTSGCVYTLSIIAFNCFCLIFSQSERPYIHFFLSAHAISGPSVAIIVSKLCTYVSGTWLIFCFLLWGGRCAASVVMKCTVVLRHRGHRGQSDCFTPRRGGPRFRTANSFAPSRRFREDRRGSPKLATRGRCQNK